MRKLKAVSLVEIILVVVVLVVLAGLGLPSYRKAVEKNRLQNAEFNLTAIYNAQKRYRLDRGSYYYCQGDPCTLDELANKLGLQIRDSYFAYSINDPGAGVGFEAVARKSSGLCEGQEIVINQTSSQPQRAACNYW